MQILPRLTDSFLGREKELGRLRKFFLRQHLFVIKGIGGIGKTTFALAFLEELKKQKPKKNILWIECHEGWRLENLLLEIDSWLKEAGDMSFSSWLKGDKKDIKEGILFLIDILNKKEFILFADDFHLVQDENIKLFLSLLNTYLNARIVFISREDIPSSPFEKLDIFEEKLEGLPVNVAVNLLKDLLDLHKLSHQPDNKNLLRIAEKVAGHPLLLKLTASLIIARSLDLEEIFSEKAPREIEDYLFSNVLNKFSSNERRILEVLALSDIPIAEDAIKTMLKIKDIKEITAILQRKFLLDRDASGNIFIHQLIAQYMANSMAEELKMSLHRKLGKYFEKIGLSQEAFSQFLEGKELLKASRILAGSASKMYRHGQYELLVEDSNKLEKVLPGINPRILIAKARALYILGKWEQSLSILHRMENIITDRALLAELFTSIAFVYHYRGNMEKAVAFYEKSLKLFKSSSASRSIVSCLNNMALICSLRGEISRSRKYLQRSFEISSRENNMELLAHALMVKGCMHNAAGEYEESIQAVEEALKLTSNRTSVRFTSETRRQMGIAYFGLGKLDEAKNIFEENLLESKKVGHTLATGFSLLYIGIIAWEKGEYREAMEALTAASSNFIGQGSLVNDARTHYYIALNHIDEGREEIAITILENSLETVK
ncbi:MAG: hypothetical protein M1536_09230 [Firmicutes bacterium]|nr:hypothetical protein [Bacillota bacterium]